MQFQSNQQIPCSYCGYGPVIGQETNTPHGGKIIHECRWTCPRCGNLVRRDEEILEPNEKK